MASTTLLSAPLEPHMDRRVMDAARALLGVSPASSQPPVGTSTLHKAQDKVSSLIAASYHAAQSPSPSLEDEDPPTEDLYINGGHVVLSDQAEVASAQKKQPNSVTFANREIASIRRPRSGSVGLDALAALASQEQASIAEGMLSKNTGLQGVAHNFTVEAVAPPTPAASSLSRSIAESSDDDSAVMPPPPPRRRRRSASNPEGMEKWDSLNRMVESSDAANSRLHFVLPASILEEELALASRAVEERGRHRRKPVLGSSLHGRTIPEDAEVLDHDDSEEQRGSRAVSKSEDIGDDADPAASAESHTVVDESELTPDELLRRARSRLLQDLSDGGMGGEKGVMTLPHSFAKYKEVYNTNGRIGIYTPAERTAIIARFNSKRTRRVWNKKIRYNCRKSLADRRLRVKGRFVKRSEQELLAKQLNEKLGPSMEEEEDENDDGDDHARRHVMHTDVEMEQQVVLTVSPAENDHDGNHHDPEQQQQHDDDHDADMPDVNDPEAGFAPTEDLPYRRLRRHTIT